MSHKSLAHTLTTKLRTEDVKIQENITFESLLLSDTLLKGLQEQNYIKPSPIQLKAIPVGRCGFDLVVKSKSGTGKTLVFSIICLESIKSPLGLQALILAPTREIAVQIVDVLRGIGIHYKNLNIEHFIGGLSYEEDIKKCKTCHIAVGAPGRIKHLIVDGHLKPSNVRLLVLDEADKLLEGSFQNDLNEIYNSLPERKQIIAASATYPDNLALFLKEYMLSPTVVSAEVESPLLLGLKQFALKLNCSNVAQQMKIKNEELCNILSKVSFTQSLVFTNYQTRAESVCNMLKQKGWSAVYISGAQTQLKRLEAVNDLKDFKCRILLSTDLTARGIDASNVDLVINYDVPIDAVTYLHRMGRAGRFGSSGKCITLISKGPETEQLQNILGQIGGTVLSIPILPKTFENDPTDSTEPMQQLYGTIESSEKSNTTLIEEVYQLKTANCKKAQKKTKKKNAAYTNHESLRNFHEDTNATGDESFKCKDEDKKRKRELKDFEDTEVLLSVINDSKSDPSEFQDLNTELLLKQMASNSTLVTNFTLNPNEETDDKKRRTDSEYSSDIDPVFCKNKALFSVSKTLLDDSAIEKDDLETLSEYLKIIKKDEQPQEKKSFESIFRVAHDYILDNEAPHWMDCCSEEQSKQLEKISLEEDLEDVEMSCDYVNKEVDCVELKDEQFMKWVPVEKTEVEMKRTFIKDSDTDSYEQFNSYFDQCSNNLWQTGLTFQNVADFDEWYQYEWQTQLSAVRNFVQQNIYVKEMSKFQNQGYKE